MKIVVTIATIDPRQGGPARSVPALCRAFVDQGIDLELVTIAERGKKAEQLALNGIEATVIETTGNRYQPGSWRSEFKAALHKGARSKEQGAKETVLYDVGLWLPSNHFAAQIAAQTQTPLVSSPRGMLSKEALKVSKWKKMIAWNLYQRRDLNSARVLHATSEKEAEEFRDMGLTQPIAVVPNGVGGSQGANFTAGGRELSANRSREAGNSVLVKTEGIRTLLFLSRLHPMKGLKDLVQAWPRVRPNGWRVVVAGPDENRQRAECEELAGSLGVRKDFEFVGAVDDQQKWKLFSEADLFVLPSYSESFGMAIAEALAAGVPVITTKATPWREIETHHCGWWVNTGVESIAAALQSATACGSQELRAMGERGRKLVERNYSWESAAKKLLSVFEWVLGKAEKPTCIV